VPWSVPGSFPGECVEMTRAEYCRAQAVECDALARAATNPETKYQLERLAVAWRQLADDIDKVQASGR
jgi:hypothetical protein